MARSVKNQRKKVQCVQGVLRTHNLVTKAGEQKKVAKKSKTRGRKEAARYWKRTMGEKHRQGESTTTAVQGAPFMFVSVMRVIHVCTQAHTKICASAEMPV